MLLFNDPIFCDPITDDVLPVIELLTVDDINLDKNHVYLIGDTIYKYRGRCSLDNIIPGTIFTVEDRNYVEEHDEEHKELYNIQFVMSKREYDKRTNDSDNMADMLKQYTNNYRANNNILRSGNIKIVPSGEIYMPELSPDDDPLERITKLMLRHMKLVLNDFRGQFSKKHGLDNIKSALNGATKNMSIVKFISWCDTLGLEWEITFDNVSPNVDLPLSKPIIISSTKSYPWVEIPEETKNCFTVKLTEGEDPLKRGIKLVLNEKRLDLKDYKHKSPTLHLLNNMKAALKSKQKMTLPYCINWSEIIDIIISFKIINPKDGIWYKMTGYDMTTNDKEMS